MLEWFTGLRKTFYVLGYWFFIKRIFRGYSGSPVVRTLCFHCWGAGVPSLDWDQDPIRCLI